MFESAGIFDACGRVRTAEARAHADARRLHDNMLADRCERLGIDPYRSDGPITAVDILTEGQSTSDLGRAFSRRRFFQTISSNDNLQHMRLAAAYFEGAERPQVYELILRPKAGKPLTRDYRSQHKDHVQRVGAACKEMQRLGIAIPIFVARHPRPVGNGHVVDLHSHVLIESSPKHFDALVTLTAIDFATDERGVQAIPRPVGRVGYLIDPRHWRMSDDTVPGFDSLMLNEGRSPVLPRSSTLPRQGLATGFDDEAFLRFWRETSGLRWIEVIGPLRRFRTQNVPAGNRLAENILGEVVVVAKAKKPKRIDDQPLRFTAGPVALAARLSWIDEVLRPVILVRGWTGCWGDLASRYDLERLVRKAHEAWAAHPAELERVALTNSVRLTIRKRPP